MYSSWTCLMVEKGPGLLSSEVSAALQVAACDLYFKRWDKMRIEGDVCVGTIETEWKTFSVSARTGILFRAKVETETGGYKVNFLLAKKDLEKGANALRKKHDEESLMRREAAERFPVEELYQFDDPQPPRSNHTLH